MTTETNKTSPIMLEPGVGNAYGNGWRQLWKNFLELLLTGIVWLAVTIPVGIIVGLIFSIGWAGITWGFDIGSFNDFNLNVNVGAEIVNGILNIVYFTPVLYGLLFVFLGAARADSFQLGDIFAAFRKNYVNVILTGILYFVIFTLPSYLLTFLTDVVPVLGVLLSLVWFIVAIVLYCKLAFVPFLLLDKNLAAGDAIRTSWQWTNGHALEIFLIALLGIPIMIVGLICLVVGVIPAIMWITMAVASMYHAVSQQHEATYIGQNPIVTEQ